MKNFYSVVSFFLHNFLIEFFIANDNLTFFTIFGSFDQFLCWRILFNIKDLI